MKSIFIEIFILGVFERCSALPIGPTTGSSLGESNKYFLGGLIFLSIGAVFGACICCRRRKKGFEEFQNESGTLESNRTEYPIFRALSPESQRNIVAANARVAGDNDNLIEEDFDNNNGPISPADLENIENNNAVDYIQNQNEVSAVVEQSPSSTNHNLIQPCSEVIQDAEVSSATPGRLGTEEDRLDAVSSSDVVIICEEEEPIVSTTTVEQVLFAASPKALNESGNSNTSQLTNVPIYSVESEKSVVSKIEMEIISTDPLSNDAENTVLAKNCNLNDDVTEGKGAKDSFSLKSNSSEKSNDVNSVEEALRALDSAIAIGEFPNTNICDDDADILEEDNFEGYDFDVDDDDDDHSASSETNRKNLHNVIRQLLSNNGANNFLPDLSEKFDSTYDALFKNDKTMVDDDLEEQIRNEAILLVDSILREGQKIVCDKLNETHDESQKINENENENVEVNEEANLGKLNEIVCKENETIIIITPSNDLIDTDTKTEEIPDLSPLDDLTENDFRNLAMQTSTPCIQNKFFNRMDYNEQAIRVQKLFDETTEPPVLDSTITIDKNSSNTFVMPINTTTIIRIEENSPDTDENNGTFVLPKQAENVASNATFDLGENGNNENGFTYPGDPCTSKQAMERDCGYLSVHREREEMNSDDLNTITPVNTPIELNYSQETWNKIMKKSDLDNDEDTSQYDACESSSGWFLHPQANTEVNETFDVEDETNLESTFEALRKQLAEVLPQPQNIAGPPDFSDEEDEQFSNRTFDEYRSPLDGLIGLLENEPSTSTAPQNELFINYKRPLSPIIEESEEETCRTFVMNETKCLDSTSTGCADTGEAIMGVTKTLMASNDTLFNFEDTLGEREDVFSPRTPSRTDTNPNTPVKSGISTEENSVETNDSGSKKSENLQSSNSEDNQRAIKEKRSPPKTINFIEEIFIKQESDLCSPDQQKTFSEGTSSTGEHGSSDLSATNDVDNTFTTNTIDEKTCITVILKDDERISEISEPEWGSTASYGGYEMNSLSDVPSLDFLNDIGEKGKENDDHKTQDLYVTKIDIEVNDDDANYQDSSEELKNTELSSDNTTYQENSVIEEKPAQQTSTNNDSSANFPNDSEHRMPNMNGTSHKEEFEYETSKLYENSNTNHTMDIDSSKENADPNIKCVSNKTISNNECDLNTSYQKVQTNSQDAVINDKIRNISSHLVEGDIINGLQENIIHQKDSTILPVKHQQTITNYSVNDVSGIQNEQNCLVINDEIIAQLSGEEDPWAEQLTDIRFIGPCAEVISTSFTANEWDSDVDDSHSSEEFMYVRGPAPNKSDDKSKSVENSNSDNRNIPMSSEDEFESHVWSSHEDKVPVGNTIEDETSEESSSEFEGEFVPSCWDSMATPARSALKSPDKSSSEEEPKTESKKRRSVAFKKQRYHSVYEYPRENSSLSPAYSEPFLWNKNSGTEITSDDNEMTAEFNDGFTVSSSMRPFHGSQFNALCHTWPTNSDFSWSQIEDLNEFIDDKKLATYSNVDIKWPSRESSTDDSSEMKTYNKTDESLRPDSGVGESADTISERLLLGELCHTKSTLRLPLDVISPNELLPEIKPENNKEPDYFAETAVLPTPSCTGSMDSLSSSSSSERQISFSTFGKRNNYINESEKKIVKDNLDSIFRPSLILIENDSIVKQIAEKIKQGDSTDEDSGIESIMKVNKDND